MNQPSGFAERDDLAYFLKTIRRCDYRHEPHLAPTKDILDGYKKKDISLDEYKELRVIFFCTDVTDDTAIFERSCHLQVWG